MTHEVGSRLAHYPDSRAHRGRWHGEVYRARDRKLGRDVAIKVLPDDFARQWTVMMAVAMGLEPTLRPGIPREPFAGDYAEKFDVFPNGGFAMVTLADVDLRELELVVNGSSELAALFPAESSATP